MDQNIKSALLIPLTVLLLGAVSVRAAGAAPVAENLELITDRGAVLSGQLSALDPDGDELRFLLTAGPRHGSLLLHESGEFLYSPEGHVRRDYFGYRAVDSEGNESEEAAVIIRISRSGNKKGSLFSQAFGQ